MKFYTKFAVDWLNGHKKYCYKKEKKKGGGRFIRNRISMTYSEQDSGQLIIYNHY